MTIREEIYTYHINKSPNDAAMYSYRGSFYMFYQRKNADGLKKAISDFEMAVRLEPDNYYWHQQLGAVCASGVSYGHWTQDFGPVIDFPKAILELWIAQRLHNSTHPETLIEIWGRRLGKKYEIEEYPILFSCGMRGLENQLSSLLYKSIGNKPITQEDIFTAIKTLPQEHRTLLLRDCLNPTTTLGQRFKRSDISLFSARYYQTKPILVSIREYLDGPSRDVLEMKEMTERTPLAGVVRDAKSYRG